MKLPRLLSTSWPAGEIATACASRQQIYFVEFRLSDHRVPAGFARQVYDRAVEGGFDGSGHAGEVLPPKAVDLPVSLESLGVGEPLLIRVAGRHANLAWWPGT